MIHNTFKYLEAAQCRQDLYRKIRDYFYTNNVLEVETPILSQGTVVDAYIDVMTTFDGPHNISEKYLQTSPELYMKRLLCYDFPSIFQIGKAFRKEEVGKIHRTEFSMLEWYRLDYSYKDLMEEVCKIVQLAIPGIPSIKKTYRDLFLEYTNLDPINSSKLDLLTYIEKEKYKNSLNLLSDISELDSKDDLLMYILSIYIEPKIPKNCLYFIYDYPRSQASLAQISYENPKIAKRFEVYYNGVELCNGFEELREGLIYRKRFELENIKRKDLKKNTLELDINFLSDVESSKTGLPPCSGVALGLDRLIMLILKKETLDDILPFR